MRYEEYLKSNERPADLCAEIDAAIKHNKLLKKENEELRKDKEYLDKVNNEQTEVILKLNEQIEKMKNCENCIKTKKAKCDDNLRVLAKINKTCDNWELGE